LRNFFSILDFLVEIVVLVFRLPIAERHAQRIEQRAVGIDAGLLQRLVFVLGNEDQVARPAPVLEQRLERLADDALARRAGDAAQRLQFVEIVLDEKLAHSRLVPRFGRYLRSQEAAILATPAQCRIDSMFLLCSYRLQA
jgi:hypothetical protein